jgi:hypothetical protein
MKEEGRWRIFLAYYTLANSWLLLVDGIQVWLRKRNNDIVIAVDVLS